MPGYIPDRRIAPGGVTQSINPNKLNILRVNAKSTGAEEVTKVDIPRVARKIRIYAQNNLQTYTTYIALRPEEFFSMAGQVISLGSTEKWESPLLDSFDNESIYIMGALIGDNWIIIEYWT